MVPGGRDDDLHLLRHGLSLDGKALAPAVVRWVGPNALQFILQEGRKHQIRRMCDCVGLRVDGLHRVRVGALRLHGLRPGQWAVVADAAAALGTVSQRKQGGTKPPR